MSMIAAIRLHFPSAGARQITPRVHVSLVMEISPGAMETVIDSPKGGER
jgi:hypothetical protein